MNRAIHLIFWITFTVAVFAMVGYGEGKRAADRWYAEHAKTVYSFPIVASGGTSISACESTTIPPAEPRR